MSMEFDADTVSAPRLVVMKRGDGGYGFNLHGERNVQAGQTISAVDDGSEAQKAGLRVGDKVIEVNGLNVEKMSHSDVVKRIKTNPNEVSMLVVDHITQAYLKQEGRPITADMANLMTVYQVKEVSAEPEAQPEEPEEPEPTPVVEESVPEVQESDASAPTPTEQETEPPKEDATTTETEIANDATTPEEVKQLQRRLLLLRQLHYPLDQHQNRSEARSNSKRLNRGTKNTKNSSSCDRVFPWCVSCEK